MNKPANDNVLLQVDRLSKFYPDGDVRALRGVSFEIRRNEYVSVMGPSGSGKSTLLNLLGGLDRPTEGEVYFDGQPLSAMPSLDRYRSEKLGFIFQSFQLLPALTALENVQVPMFETRLSVSQRVAKARTLLESVGMSHRLGHLPKTLSVGERQRVAIARALANDPALLLADEPTGNLDTTNAAAILDLFAGLHRDRHVTILVITHDPQLAQRTERILRMQDGQLVADERVR